MKQDALRDKAPPPPRLDHETAELLRREAGFTVRFPMWLQLAGILSLLQIAGLVWSFMISLLAEIVRKEGFRLVLALLLAALILVGVTSALSASCLIRAARALRKLERIARGES